MKMFDITRAISPNIAVWPGDAAPDFRWTARIEEGSSVNVGAIRISTHTGTHVDAPLHYTAGGPAVEAYDLSTFVGQATVIDCSNAEAVEPDHLRNLPAGTERLLVKTGHSHLADTDWTDAITHFLPETIDELGRMGVRLVGTDAPSFDPVDSRSLPAHHRLAHHGIANLENLQLAEVSPGVYFLAALPLKLEGMDAAPVRAVLMHAG